MVRHALTSTGRPHSLVVYRAVASNDPLEFEMQQLIHLPAMIELRGHFRIRFILRNPEDTPYDAVMMIPTNTNNTTNNTTATAPTSGAREARGLFPSVVRPALTSTGRPHSLGRRIVLEVRY